MSRLKSREENEPFIIHLRTPLSPFSMIEEIQRVETKMPGGRKSAKGRRMMFRNSNELKRETAG